MVSEQITVFLINTNTWFQFTARANTPSRAVAIMSTNAMFLIVAWALIRTIRDYLAEIADTFQGCAAPQSSGLLLTEGSHFLLN